MMIHNVIPHHHHSLEVHQHNCPSDEHQDAHNDSECDFNHDNENTECDACHFNSETTHKDSISKTFLQAYLLVLRSRSAVDNSLCCIEWVSFYKKPHKSYYPLRAPPQNFLYTI